MALRVAGTLGVWIAAGAALFAADFWHERPFTAWSDREVEFVTILNESEVKTTFQLKAMLFAGRLTL